MLVFLLREREANAGNENHGDKQIRPEKKKRNLVFGKQGKCSTLEGSGNEDPNKNWRNDWLVSEFKFLNPQNMIIPWGQFNMSFPAVIIQHS